MLTRYWVHALCVCARDVTVVAAAGGASDEEVEALEHTISELEKRCEALEDDVRNSEAERDLVGHENKVC